MHYLVISTLYLDQELADAFTILVVIIMKQLDKF